MGQVEFNGAVVQSSLTEFQSQVKLFDEELEKFELSKIALRSFWEQDEATMYEAIFSRFQAGATALRNVYGQVHNALGEMGDEHNDMKRKMQSILA